MLQGVPSDSLLTQYNHHTHTTLIPHLYLNHKVFWSQSLFNLQEWKDWIKTSVHFTMILRWSNCSIFCIYKWYFNRKSLIPEIIIQYDLYFNFENLLVENQHFFHLWTIRVFMFLRSISYQIFGRRPSFAQAEPQKTTVKRNKLHLFCQPSE